MKLLQTLCITVFLLFSTAVMAERVNINKASADEIAQGMTGIGSSKAQAIVKYRETHGKFTSVQELEKVVGIGEKTVARNKDKVTL